MSDKSPISLRGRRLKLKEKNLGALYYIGSFWLRKEKKYWDVVVIMKSSTFFCFFFCIIRGYVLSCFTESANLVACEKAPGSSFRRENHLLIPLKRGCSFRFEIYLVFYIVPRPSDRHDTQSCQLGGGKEASENPPGGERWCKSSEQKPRQKIRMGLSGDVWLRSYVPAGMKRLSLQ